MANKKAAGKVNEGKGVKAVKAVKEVKCEVVGLREISDFVTEHNTSGLGKSESIGLVNLIVDQIQVSLLRGCTVSLRGVGSFVVKNTEARMGRNPATGEEIQIEAGKKVTFKVSTTLKKAVKES